MKGHIRERSPGHFAIILEQRNSATGKRKRKWHTFKGTKRQAQIECARLISEMKGGTYLEPSKTTSGQFLERWLEHMRSQISPNLTRATASSRERTLLPCLARWC